MTVQTQYGRDLYQDLMALCESDESPFYYVDHLFNGTQFRVFTYRLASYTDFLKPSALECRGITFITKDDKYESLAALTPRKFFNLNENQMAMNLDFSKTRSIMDKMDGSIMTTYKLPIADMVYLKSKTALQSDQAIAANEFLQLEENSTLHNFLMYMMHKGYSVSMEFTDAKFRIVLPYQKTNLTIFSARDLTNGMDYPYSMLQSDMEEFGCVQHLVKDHFYDIDPVKLIEFVDNIPNMKDIEGYVINVDGMNIKVKCDWYKNLHSLKDNVTHPRNLFECVVNELSDDVRAHFSHDIYLLNRIDEMELIVRKLYKKLDAPIKFFHDNSLLSRKEFALKAKDELEPMMFNVAMSYYTGKPFDDKAWLIKHYKDFNISDECASTD
jgi:T4 RnlA family RNA ligase